MPSHPGTLELKSEKSDADPYGIMSVQFSPDGTKIVSGGQSGTIKVWDAGAPWAQNHLFLASPWPKLMPGAFLSRYTRVEEREAKRAQQLDPIGRLLTGWDQDRLWIERQDDQSLGCWCAMGLKSPLLGLS